MVATSRTLLLAMLCLGMPVMAAAGFCDNLPGPLAGWCNSAFGAAAKAAKDKACSAVIDPEIGEIRKQLQAGVDQTCKKMDTGKERTDAVSDCCKDTGGTFVSDTTRELKKNQHEKCMELEPSKMKDEMKAILEDAKKTVQAKTEKMQDSLTKCAMSEASDAVVNAAKDAVQAEEEKKEDETKEEEKKEEGTKEEEKTEEEPKEEEKKEEEPKEEEKKEEEPKEEEKKEERKYQLSDVAFTNGVSITAAAALGAAVVMVSAMWLAGRRSRYSQVADVEEGEAPLAVE